MPKPFNHFSFSNRQTIEKELNSNSSFSSIALLLVKHHSSIAREVKRNRICKGANPFNSNKIPCIKFWLCGSSNCSLNLNCYTPNLCPLLAKAPFVCNACKSKIGCRKIKYYYVALHAHSNYKNNFSFARQGFDLSTQQINDINRVIVPLLLKQSQSINHVFINHPDLLDFSLTSFYTYIHANLFNMHDMDLRRKASLKPRINSKKRRNQRERSIIKLRNYNFFLDYIDKNPNENIVEIDCVIGLKSDSKTLLTLLWRKANFMLIFLLEKQNTFYVNQVFSYLKQTLGIDEYKKLFAVVLCDRGSEFLNPYSIELDYETGEEIAKVFYCNPGAAYQKGTLERNHEFIRYFLPKGLSFDFLTQENCIDMANNINSTCRNELNKHCPHQAMLLLTNEELLSSLNCTHIIADDVILNKSIFDK